MFLILLLLIASCQQDHIKPKGELSILDVNREIIEYLRNLGFEIMGEIGNWESGNFKATLYPADKSLVSIEKIRSDINAIYKKYGFRISDSYIENGTSEGKIMGCEQTQIYYPNNCYVFVYYCVDSGRINVVNSWWCDGKHLGRSIA